MMLHTIFQVQKSKDRLPDRRLKADRRNTMVSNAEWIDDQRKSPRRFADRRGYFNETFDSYKEQATAGLPAAYDLKNYFEHHHPVRLE
ncbi:MAG: hypothetical protein HQM12_13860 [SAR324 cluster bacterium]|nr:hypothetical protein [SAR324 cluster bacterium]